MKLCVVFLCIASLYGAVFAQVTDIEYPLLAKYMFNGNTDDSGELKNNAVGTEIIISGDRNDVGGRAYALDGSRSFITTPIRINQNNSSPGITYMAWVKPTSISDGRKYLLSTDTGKNEWSLLRDGDRWMVATGTGIFETGFTVDLNEWQHMVVVFTQNYVDVYKNSEKIRLNSVGFSDADTNLIIGGGHRKPGERFAAVIDEVRVYAAVVNDDYIRETYMYNRPPSSSILAGAYTFETSLKDNSQYGKELSMIIQPTYYAGRKNTMSALYLNGIDQLTSTNVLVNQHKNSKGLTFVAWLKPEADTRKRQFICSTNTGNMEWSVLRNGSAWSVFNGEKQINTKLKVDDGVWQFIAVVFKPGDGVYVYKNSEVEKIPHIGYVKDSRYVSLFADRKFPSEAFLGIVDDLYIFSEALSVEKVTALYTDSFEEIVTRYAKKEVYTNSKIIVLGYAFSTGIGNQPGKKGGVSFQIPLSSVRDGDSLLLEKVSGILKYITVAIEPRRGANILVYKGTDLKLPVRTYFEKYRKDPAMKNIIININGDGDTFEKTECRVKIHRKILIGEEY